MFAQIALFEERFLQVVFDKFWTVLSSMSIDNGKNSILRAAIKVLIRNKSIFLCDSMFSLSDAKSELISTQVLVHLNFFWLYNRFLSIARSETFLVISKSKVTARSGRHGQKLSLIPCVSVQVEVKCRQMSESVGKNCFVFITCLVEVSRSGAGLRSDFKIKSEAEHCLLLVKGILLCITVFSQL